MLILECLAFIQEVPPPHSELLSKADTWVVAISTALLFFVTGWLALETRKMRKESAKAIEATAKSAELAKEAMERSSSDSKATALLSLYTTYSSPHFEAARYSAWELISLSIKCKDYFDFLVSTHFVTEYQPGGIPENIANALWDCGKATYPNRFGSIAKFLKWEQRARHDFEDMMHFYSLVNHRIQQKDCQDRYEFYYDWWRPFFWWMSDAMDSYYKTLDSERKKYISAPKWGAIWESLDSIYGFAPGTESSRREALKSHPIAISWGVDPKHTLASPKESFRGRAEDLKPQDKERGPTTPLLHPTGRSTPQANPDTPQAKSP